MRCLTARTHCACCGWAKRTSPKYGLWYDLRRTIECTRRPVSVTKAAVRRWRRLLASRRRDNQPLAQQHAHGLMRGTHL